ncbi:glycoside hydrolase family 99-like domain-containing protein [Jiangella endophytica]|uniref:glycoside hydrolase family 99-like domain-containing protein n=1 Tax=Jiangella endophytica TaxID=1623398 RepID=UPI000E3539C9|nr:glycoside hydrolase family 99-like domain-containing protein [Jiangella endophytica]
MRVIRKTTVAIVGTAAVLLALLPATAATAGDARPAAVRAPAETSAVPDDDYVIGTYYFSGWYQEPNRHFSNPLINGGRDWRLDAPEREPAYGWYDDSQTVMDQQIIDASSNGVDYFVFDWFPDRPDLDDREGGMGQGGSYGLHNGLNLFRTSPNKSSMQFSLIWANHAPFDMQSLRTPGMTQAAYEAARAAEWDTITDEWVELFADPQYLKIDNKPVISTFDVQSMQKDFSTGTRPNLNPHQLAGVPEERAVLADAIAILRQKAKDAGFADVLFGAGLTQPGPSGEYVAAHDQDDDVYDFFSSYNWAPLKWTDQLDLSYHNMIRSHHDYVWDYYAANVEPETDYIPVISAGWDNILRTDRERWVDQHTPLEFGSMLREAKAFLDEHPQQSLSGGSDLKMAVIASWNELFEGHAIVPTKAEGDAWVSQVGEVFGTRPAATAPSDELASTVAAVQALHEALPSQSPTARRKVATLLIQLRLLGRSLEVGDAESVPDTQVRFITTALKTLEQSVQGQPEAWPVDAPTFLSSVRTQWDSTVAAIYGVRVAVAASDYSVVEDQDVALNLALESEGGGNATATDAEWTIEFPSSWQLAPLHVQGVAGQVNFAVPTGTTSDVSYVLDSLLPTPSTLVGSLQDLSVTAEFTIGGVDHVAEVPVQLTTVPPVDAKVVTVPFAGEDNVATIWLDNLSDEPITGGLELEDVAGVTDDLSDAPFTLQPRERRSVEVTITNTLTEAQDLDLVFDTVERGPLALEVVTAQPHQQIVPTSAALDASIRSTGVVELSSPDRLQVGNSATSSGDLEYRVVLSIPLDGIQRDQVSTALLDLTQFQYIRPGEVVIEHLPPASTITSAAYGAASSASKVLAAGTSATDTTTSSVQSVDLTDWVNVQLDADATHLTVRLRMSTITPGTSMIRAYRPAEFTPADALDSSLLRVW